MLVELLQYLLGFHLIAGFNRQGELRIHINPLASAVGVSDDHRMDRVLTFDDGANIPYEG